MLRTLAHHWRINLAVALGAAVACAVLAGALLVGDSVRGSLRELTLQRLGEIDHALTAHRFFRAGLVDDFAARAEADGPLEPPVPLIMLRGAATHGESGARASRIGIQGVDERFAGLWDAELDLARAPGQLFPSVAINASLQRELGAEVGDSVLLEFGRWSDIPRETLMGNKGPDDVLGSLRLTVVAVLDDRGLGRFGLIPSQQTPLNAFVPLRQLQRALDLRGQVNAMLVSERRRGADPQRVLESAITLRDLGLVVHRREDHLAVTSREFVLRPAVDEAVGEAARELGAPMMRTQSYLANEIRAGERSIPYSMVVALDPRNGNGWSTLPLVDGTRAGTPAGDGIYLNSWAAEQLDVTVEDTVTLLYYVVGVDETLTETRASFRVEGIARIEGLGADRTLTPDYPGIEDAEDISAWDPPFPVDLDRIRTEDELYWDRYGPTPKAFVSLETGQRLWATRFGSTTAVRVGVPAGGDLDDLAGRFESALARRLSPAAFGLEFRPVKAEGLRASAGATDFAGLFVGFSMFLIVSAALLIGLLFRLGVERRAREIGLLLATGFTVGKVRRGLLAEGGLLAALGGLVGLAGAIGFAGLMMLGLRTIWEPAVGSSELYLHVGTTSLVAGWLGTLAVVLLSVHFAVRRLVRVPPPRLLLGAVTLPARRGAGRPTFVLAWGGLAGALGLVATALVTRALTSPGLAFGAGSLLLVAGLAFFSRWCKRTRRRRVAGTLAGMAARNSSWNPGRSMLSVALVAAACFMIVVVEVFRIEPGAELDARDSGAGGFRLVAESDVPLLQRLDRRDDLFELGLSDEAAAQLDGIEIVQARMLPGDDASCNNLYRPERPTLLGVPRELIDRGGFRFAKLLDAADGADPWTLLDLPLERGVIPAIADATSAQWIMHKGLGEELVLDDEFGRPLRLRLVGLLDRSLFRSEVLISEKHFLQYFPSRAGDSYFLIDAPEERVAELTGLLESALDSFGFDATSTREKIAGYEAVQNTYLSTFQVLGALGLLLGTVGLGIVLVRNVIERHLELAVLRAFGYRRSRLAAMVLAENAFLLVVGVAVGTLAALAAVGPSLSVRSLPWPSLSVTLAVVIAVGMLSSLAAVAAAMRVPLLPALKADA